MRLARAVNTSLSDRNSAGASNGSRTSGRSSKQLGYQVTLDRRGPSDFPDGPPSWTDPARTQIWLVGWGADYLAPANFLGLFKCDSGSLNSYCDPEFDRTFDHALELQVTDPAAALAEWAALDRWVVDLAIMAPLGNSDAVFVSKQVGNYQFHPAYGSLLDQMWVQ